MGKKKKILFVDDEPRVLNGLRRMLHSMGGEWDMVFAPGGRVALDILETGRFDIIVSDMDMPGMNGRELLDTVRRRYPQMIRLMLSGHSSRELFFQSAGPIHQYLSMPADIETLKNTVDRSSSWRELLANSRLTQLISQLESLPCLPSSYRELMAELESEHASAKKIAAIIGRDVGMSVKLLQMANSSYFGIRQPVASVTQATVLLGLDTIKTLVISARVFSYFDRADPNVLSLSKLWDHSMAVADWAKRIALRENTTKETAESAKMAGMLHDIGKLIFASKIPREYEHAIRLGVEAELPSFEAEQAVMGATHAEVGAYLLGLWGFHDSIVEALALHHKPGVSVREEFTALTAVHSADALTREEHGEDCGTGLAVVDMQYLERLGLADRFRHWKEACWERTTADC